ncbi:MAG: cptB [Rhizobacter sp.]|nr:cptB [Rhizobacter sp.]
MNAYLDARSVDRLRWSSRRGMLENDLFIDKFFASQAATLTEQQAQGFTALMDLSDPDLLDLLLRRVEPQGELATPQVRDVLELMRAPPAQHPVPVSAFLPVSN